jgi:hypothetical protein
MQRLLVHTDLPRRKGASAALADKTIFRMILLLWLEQISEKRDSEVGNDVKDKTCNASSQGSGEEAR